jgi:hypothetical protein
MENTLPSFCQKCGTKFEEGQEFCPKCGNPRTTTAPVVQKKRTGKGFAITSFVIGICSVSNSLILMGMVIDWSPASELANPVKNDAPMVLFGIILGIIFGTISFFKHKRKLALTGIILSTVSLLFLIISGLNSFFKDINYTVPNTLKERQSQNEKETDEKTPGLIGVYERDTMATGNLIKRSDEDINQFTIEFINNSDFKFTINDESAIGGYSQNNENADFPLHFELPNGFIFDGKIEKDTLIVSLSGDPQIGGITFLMGFIAMQKTP